MLDVETTGINPLETRMVEIAIVEIDRGGRMVDEYSTLLSVPGEGPVGAEFIHHISREMLAGAPTFAEVIGQITSHLVGRIIVGHVVAFDLGHMREEFRRANLQLPVLVGATLCTRDLARVALPPGPKTLQACCSALGIEIKAAHTALGDARATADLLIRLLRSSDDVESLGKHAASIPWPEIPVESTAPKIRDDRDRSD